MNHSRMWPLLVIALATLACSLGAPAATTVARAGPRAWIDAPLDGSALPMGSIEVVSHASDGSGIAQIEFSVNGVVVRALPGADAAQTLVTTRQAWSPPAPGNFTLSIRAQAGDGRWSDSAAVVVTVLGERVEPVEPTATPTERPGVTPAPTDTPTPLPRPTGTPIPQPPSPTNTPESLIFFGSDATITQGQCATLTWQTDWVDAVYLDGVGVAGTGSITVCPAATSVYTLSALKPNGETVNRQVTITVLPPADTAGPSIARIAASTAYFYRSGSCNPKEVTITALVTDPSGVAGVTLWYRVLPARVFTSVGMDFIGSDSYRRTVNGSDVPGASIGTWEFYLTAQDAFGNATQSPTDTSVQLVACVAN